MTRRVENETSYDVEVSGWDLSEDFFVEKATLHWDSEQGKKILLRNRVQKGNIVFVRLAQSLTAANSFPVAYQAEEVGPPDGHGLCEIALVQLRPKKNSRENDVAVEPEIIGAPLFH